MTATRPPPATPSGIGARAGVSFVMPVYNKERYLPRVLEALGRQVPDRPRQFIFVDDGSRDASPAVVEQVTRDWPDTIVLGQHNQGPAAATNRGLSHVHHPFIKLVGSDDVLAPFATDLLLDVAESTGAGIVFSDMAYYGDEAEIAFDEAAARRATPTLPRDPLADVIFRTVSGTSQTLYRADAVRAAGGADPRVFAEDFSLALRVARRWPIALVAALTCFGPGEEPDRIMVGLKHQTFHDYNLALYNFLTDHPELPARYRRLALRRATGRAWKWARREGGAGLASPFFRLNLLGRLGLHPDPVAAIRATLPAFALGRYAAARPLVYPQPLPARR